MKTTHSLKLMAVLATALALAVAAAAAGIPSGTNVTVRVGSAISSGTAQPGDTWDGSLANAVVVGGTTLAKAGAPVRGRVVDSKSSGRLHAPGILSVSLTSVDGVPVTTTRATFGGKGHTKSNAEKIGGGAAVGALIGGLAGGGKGAAIGVGAGAAAGTGLAVATGKKEAIIPAESALTFTVTSGTASTGARARSRSRTRRRSTAATTSN